MTKPQINKKGKFMPWSEAISDTHIHPHPLKRARWMNLGLGSCVFSWPVALVALDQSG